MGRLTSSSQPLQELQAEAREAEAEAEGMELPRDAAQRELEHKARGPGQGGSLSADVHKSSAKRSLCGGVAPMDRRGPTSGKGLRHTEMKFVRLSNNREAFE